MVVKRKLCKPNNPELWKPGNTVIYMYYLDNGKIGRKSGVVLSGTKDYVDMDNGERVHKAYLLMVKR